jgi:hypothetical protein
MDYTNKTCCQFCVSQSLAGMFSVPFAVYFDRLRFLIGIILNALFQFHYKTKRFFSKVVEPLPEITKTEKNKMFPHFLTVALWIFLVVSIALNLNFAVVVTQATGNGGFKVITFFQLTLSLFSVLLCLSFYSAQNEGKAEKWIFRLALLTLLVSSASISLHFAEGLTFLMETLEVIAWILYNGMFSLSILKIAVAFLLPFFER